MVRSPSEVDVDELLAAGEELFSVNDESERTYTRRIGQRVQTAFSVVVVAGDRRVRVRCAELSTTGLLLDFRYTAGCPVTGGLVTLELAVPGLPRPLRTAARIVREVGKLVAFEFMIIGRDDRLTLAEHIDRIANRGRGLHPVN